ncbi:zinc metallopeptidase RseP, partial [Erwinia amylovora]|nr:zinc metallopeptidase RseP [Erwinia amylovora]
ITLRPDAYTHNKCDWFAGVIPRIIPLHYESITVSQYGPFAAICEASTITSLMMKLTVNILVYLIVGSL